MSQTIKKILDIDPNQELRFVGPFTRPVNTMMRLKNNLDHTVIFKIKTTAPKRYCVRPNIGKIAPFQSAVVEISLQPFTYDANEKYKHKFMVQSVLAPEIPADTADITSLWKDLEAEHIIDAKLRCVFEVPPSTGKVSANVSAGSRAEEVSEEPLSNSSEVQLNSSSTLPIRDTSDIDVASEIELLRTENKELSKENIDLKEQVVRLRCLSPKPAKNEPYAPVMTPNQIPVFFIALAILALIFGALLGKYLF